MHYERQTVAQIKRRAITRIHVAKGQLGMDDEEYRFMLQATTGKTSSKAMDIAELQAVENHLKKLGFKPKARNTGNKRISPVSRHKASDQKTQVDKLRAMWIEMANAGLIRDGSENALECWVQRMSARYNHGRGIEKVDWLMMDADLASQLIESLKQWEQRLTKGSDLHE